MKGVIFSLKEFVYTIKDNVGIHARPAGQLVKMATEFKSDITISVGEKTADAKKIFSVMTLGAKQNDQVKVVISGEDEGLAEGKLRVFFEENL